MQTTYRPWNNASEMTPSDSFSSTRSDSRSHSPTSQSQSMSSSSTFTSTSTQTLNLSTASYLAYPVSHVVSGLYRRLTEPGPGELPPNPLLQAPSPPVHSDMSSVWNPPRRTASPYQPPPLTPLTLHTKKSSSSSAQILSRAIAEEIRLLVPPRLQLVSDWTLAYSVEEHGVSLTTLYSRCEEFSGRHNGFVLVVKDAAGGIFGAFLTDPPHPAPHYYGTGECFLWRATHLPISSILASLPPPPSSDTTYLTERSTTIASPTFKPKNLHSNLTPHANGDRTPSPSASQRSGTSTPERLRFKAYPYSGLNDYTIFCEANFLSVGGGDGKYGLWLDEVLERGISSQCMTFGNERLSEEGEKFEVLGVEVWYIGEI